MPLRPIRLYQHTFVRGSLLQDDPPKLVVVRSGTTPCRAKAAAFVELEVQLKQKQLPRQGWWLAAQVDVTHLAVVR